MAEVLVNTPGGSYWIKIGPGLLAQLGQEVTAVLPRVTQALVITDETVGPLYGEAALAALRAAAIPATVVTVPSGEGAKSVAMAGWLWERCAEAGLDRSSCIIALGGGVVGDLAGFVAATYMRGIAFVQVPTTLLAGVDSSVGGKTGIDIPQGKNLVGAFHQPALVLQDVALLRSLPQRELAAGMAEVVKHGVMRDPALLDWVEREAERILAAEPSLMTDLLARNVQIKASVVGQDERESGLRAILNLGHTIGHALEAVVGVQAEPGADGALADPGVRGASVELGARGAPAEGWRAGPPWVHGECVAVGLVGALVISRAVGVLEEPQLIERVERLLTRLGLPVRFPPQVPAEAILPFVARDKKATGGRVKWVLCRRAGEVLLSADVTAAQVQGALDYLTSGH
jgi:3-dehydroquinate synthase